MASCNCTTADIPLLYADFIAAYDEFSCLTEPKFNRYVKQACMEWCGFQGMCDEERLVAYELATAHLAYTFFQLTNSPSSTLAKSVKNRDEQIVYRDNLWDLTLTPYGQSLDRMLNNCSTLAAFEGNSFTYAHVVGGSWCRGCW